MRKTKEMQRGGYLLTGAVAIAMVLLLVLFADGFSIISHAESAAKVTASSVKIRKEPNAASETIGSAEQNKEISIRSQVQGSDGYTWYEVYVDANTLGYIRSDLVAITDGTTPPAGTAPAASAPTTAPAAPATTTVIPDEPLVDVTAVNPASASVTGGQSVRIRQNASTTSRIETTVKNGMALTILGTANGTDGRVWYQVTFISNGAEVTGFIRSDYTTVTPEELSSYTEEPPEGDPVSPETPPEQDPEPAPVETKAYETILEDGEWRLVVTAENKSYAVQELFDGVTQNGKMYQDSLNTIKTQKIVIIVLVFLLISIAAVVTLLIFKVKDLEDAQYFNEVENETMRHRSARAQGSGQRAMPTVGDERQGGRPAGAKLSGGSQGQRSQGGRSGSAAQGQQRSASQSQRTQGGTQGQQRPVSQGQRPQGGRSGSAAQGQQRPVSQEQRSQGGVQGQQRPASQGQRPQGGAQGQQRMVSQRPAGGAQNPVPQEQRPQGGRPAQGQQNSGWQSKNFMADDDEFEFEFLNYEGDDGQ